jgi:tetratricopeptide (TPR) repeat protein
MSFPIDDPTAGERSQKSVGNAGWLGGIVNAAGRVCAALPQSLRSTEDLRKLTVNLVTVALAALAILVISRAAFERVHVIDAIAVPKLLEERGYTGTVVAQRILDEIHEVNRVAVTTMSRQIFSPTFSESSLPKIELPVGGVSLATVVSGLRDFFGVSNPKITGEIIIAEPVEKAPNVSPMLLMRVRIASDQAQPRKDGPAYRIDDIGDLFRHAARQVIEQSTPFLAAAYYYELAKMHAAERENHLAETERMIIACINSGDREQIARAVNLRGLLALGKGEAYYEEAIIHHKAIPKDSTVFPTSRYNLAHVYRIQAEKLEGEKKRGKLLEAHAVALEGLAYDENPLSRAHGFNHVGSIFADLASSFDKRHYRDALRYFDLSIKADHKFHLAHNNRGNALRTLEPPRIDDAIASYRRAVELNPRDAEVHWKLGALLRDRNRPGDRVRASLLLKEAVRLDHNDSSAHYELGELHLVMDSWVEAEKSFRAATDIDRSWDWARYRLGLALEGGGDLLGAAEALEQAAARLPNDLTIRDALGRVRRAAASPQTMPL